MIQTDSVAAPLDIKLMDQDGNEACLQDYLGKFVVLFFYPKDNTPGCTKEACGFRDQESQIRALGAEVVGVSADSIKSHQQFKHQHSLPFPLWSDSDRQLLTALLERAKSEEVSWWKKQLLGIKRITFIIDPSGRVIKVFDKVDPVSHSDQVVDFLTERINQIKMED